MIIMHGRPTILEIASTNYEMDRENVVAAIEEIQTLCEITDGYLVSEPMARFGWTFFRILIKQELLSGIELKLGSQIAKTKGKKVEEKFVTFMTKFFEERSAKVKVTLTDD